MFRTFMEKARLTRSGPVLGWIGGLVVAALEFQVIYSMLLEWE